MVERPIFIAKRHVIGEIFDIFFSYPYNSVGVILLATRWVFYISAASLVIDVIEIVADWSTRLVDSSSNERGIDSDTRTGQFRMLPAARQHSQKLRNEIVNATCCAYDYNNSPREQDLR